MRLSFKSRFLSTLLLCVILALSIPGIYFYSSITSEIEEEEVRRAERMLTHVHSLLVRENKEMQTVSAVQDRLRQISTSLGIRITLIRANGDVAADSDISQEDLQLVESFEIRPEVEEALKRPVGYSLRESELGTGAEEVLYAAQKTEALPLIGSGFIRLEIPYSQVEDRLEKLYRNLLVFILPGLAIMILIGSLVVRQLERFIQVMIDAADSIGKGDYRKRIRFIQGKEFEPLVRSINRMAENIEGQIKTITQQKGQLETILNGIREGVAVLDEQGVIREVNRNLERIFGNVARLKGLRPLELSRNPRLQERCEFVLSEREEGRNIGANLQIELDGERFYDVDIVPLQVREADIALVMVFHDITELKRLEKIRRDFVANVSHELRTPLTSIKGYAETIKGSEGIDDQTRDSFLEVIIRNANNMSNLVRDLLQLAKLESVREDHYQEKVDPKNGLQEAWKACNSLAAQKNITLEDKIPADLLFPFHMDHLVQVFRNLLENAIKYSPGNQSVTVLGYEDDGFMTFGVKDQGPGIPKKDQERIFERFYRVEKHRNKEMPGTGLGLAICRHIVRNSGGKIWVESPPKGQNAGSVFFFSLPVKRDHQKRQSDSAKGMTENG